MSFDPKIYRNSKDGIGGPGDPKSTDGTSDWTLVSLMKGVYHVLTTTGITVTGGTLATAAKQDTGNTSLASIDTKLTSINFNTDTLETALGVLTETAPINDTASSGLNGRLQRVAQRLTSLIALVPASLGAKTAAASFSVTTATDDNSVALMGAVNETAPATDTASSGQNGRLQRIAQRLTTLLSAGATTIAKAEDVASADADVGVPAMAIRKATPANTSGTDGDYEMLQMSAGRLWVDGSGVTLTAGIAAGTNLIGRSVADAGATTGGISTTARLASAAASTNATLVKGSAGRVYTLCGKNNAAYDVFLVLYDSAASPPVPGSTTIRKKVACPAGQTFVYDFPLGLYFATGIGYAFTKLVADADTTVLVAADITAFNVDYV